KLAGDLRLHLNGRRSWRTHQSQHHGPRHVPSGDLFGIACAYGILETMADIRIAMEEMGNVVALELSFEAVDVRRRGVGVEIAEKSIDRASNLTDQLKWSGRSIAPVAHHSATVISNCGREHRFRAGAQKRKPAAHAVPHDKETVAIEVRAPK